MYLDLDCGPNKEFPDKQSALIELKRFLHESGMPAPSIVVDSGNGIHVYWTLETSILAVQWIQLAKGLKKLCVDNSFDADPTVTADSVRILRVPGTYNYKDPTKPKECKVIIDRPDVTLESLQAALLDGQNPTMTVVGNTGGALPDNSDLAGGMEKKYKKPLASVACDKCLTMKHAVTTGGEKDSQPLWALILQELAFCEDGRAYIHKVSDQHPAYDKDATETKYEEKLLNVVNESISGPPACKTISMELGSQCHQCPYYGHITNPLLTRLFKLPGALPNNYRMVSTGMEVLQDVETDEGIGQVWAQLTPYRIFDATLNVPPNEQAYYFRFKYAIGQSDEKVGEIDSSALGDVRAFNAAIALLNIHMHPEQIKGVHRLMRTWMQQMDAAKHTAHAPNRMGWTKEDKKIGFALSKKIIWDDGKETGNPLPSPELLRYYTATGKLDPWKKAAKLITGHHNIELQIALATAFASPLMHMADTHGAVLALVSQASGIGKSKALHTAQAVWGKPNQINSMDDTNNSIIRKMGILNNLPAFWDEVHMSTDANGMDDFIGTVFRLAQGKEKARLNSNSTFQNSGDWSTIVTVVSNDSVHDHLRLHRGGTDAPLMRVLEIEITKSKASNGDMANALDTFGRLDENYGVAGEEYVKFITRNYAALRSAVIKTVAHISQMKDMDQAERMRIALIASIIVGAKAANSAGLTDFNIPAMQQRMLKEIRPMLDNAGKVLRKSASVNDRVSIYMDEFAEYTNKVDQFAHQGTRQNISVIDQPRKLPVRVSYAELSNTVRVDETHFKNWITAKFGGGSRLVEEILSNKNSSRVRASLGNGLKSDTGKRKRLIEIPMP